MKNTSTLARLATRNEGCSRGCELAWSVPRGTLDSHAVNPSADFRNEPDLNVAGTAVLSPTSREPHVFTTHHGVPELQSRHRSQARDAERTGVLAALRLPSLRKDQRRDAPIWNRSRLCREGYDDSAASSVCGLRTGGQAAAHGLGRPSERRQRSCVGMSRVPLHQHSAYARPDHEVIREPLAGRLGQLRRIRQ